MTPNQIGPRTRYFLVLSLILAAGLLGLPFVSGIYTAAEALPSRLTDQQFWKLSTELSEPDGFFRSDNLLSNEIYFQYVIPELTSVAKAGRVYLGVGPEQNFTYMVALKPKIALILDVRRGNMDLQLMYKALFELSKDRAEFVSRLFCRPRPEGLTAQSTAWAIFGAYARVERSDQLLMENLAAMKQNLVSKHGFALLEGDLAGIEYVYEMFCRFGPDINYNSSAGGFGGGTNRTTYSELMTATDQDGVQRSYLATEENFNFMKDLEAKNLVVPVVGNFAGPKALRAVGKYLKGLDATVSAFYLSNVEQYLYQDGIWNNFCSNVATLPLDPTSTFIRSVRGGRFGQGAGLNSDLGNMIDNLQACAAR